jgi:hypothetical protein
MTSRSVREFNRIVAMATVVRFVGGELDGQDLSLDELPLTYRHATRRRGSGRKPQSTEYTLVRDSSGKPFYVENELLKLAKAQGVNPLPLD